MSAPTENKNTSESGPESPTTARPLDLSDDDIQSTGVLGDDGPRSPIPPIPTTTNTSARTTENAPQKPPRPQTEAQKNLQILKEAFPSVDQGVIKAVLSASGGRVEPAFNALLEMTDPDAVINEPEQEAAPPPQPPRPQGRTPMSQMEADELYARQLAEHYDNVGAYENRTSNRGSSDGRPRGQQQQQGYNQDDREHSFLDDELPIIRDNLRKGFLETQTKVNSWITTLKKKIDEGFDESEENQHGQQNQQGQQGQQGRDGQYGQQFRRQGENSRRSGDYDRYDADPEVLSDDFAGMKFTSDGTPVGGRPMANTGIYKPPQPSASPKPSNGRRVGFKEETEEINMYDASPKVPPKDATPSGSAKGSKWQPLSAVDPNPITDNDPFSLGDSEDERDVTQKPKETKENKETKDGKTDDNERLKQAAAEAMSDSLVGSDSAAKKL